MIIKEECCYLFCDEEARYMILLQPNLSAYSCVGHFLAVRREDEGAFDMLEGVEIGFNHQSDCALHSEPVEAAEACNCSARKEVEK